MSHNCQALHELASKSFRHHFPYDVDSIPLNGIYLLFEVGELGHGCDRIVRVGTHTGKNRLSSRLKEHFLVENKDRSIFRKNIGRAILAKNNDPFLNDWNLDLTSKYAKNLFTDRIDQQKKELVEKQVSKYIQESFSFVILPVSDKEERLKLESKLISTVSWCNECKSSSNWLGRFSPKDQIKESGLWLVQGLYKDPLSEEEVNLLGVVQ